VVGGRAALPRNRKGFGDQVYGGAQAVILSFDTATCEFAAAVAAASAKAAARAPTEARRWRLNPH
jgi:hypothetical protein